MTKASCTGGSYPCRNVHGCYPGATLSSVWVARYRRNLLIYLV